MNNYLSVVIDCMCATFGFVIIGVFICFQSVVECPDLLLIFSLFDTDKEFLCCVLDIVSVFAGKLVIDNWAPFDDLVASVLVGNASLFASKLDIDGLAPFNGSVEALWASGTIFYITIKVSPKKTCRLQCFVPELLKAAVTGSSLHCFLLQGCTALEAAGQ